MKLLNKIANAKTNTLVVFMFLLPILGYFTPWFSIWFIDGIDRALYAAIFVGAFGSFFEVIASIFGIWNNFSDSIIIALITIEIIFIVSLSSYLLRELYKRHKAGTANSWQFLSPTVFVGFFIVLMIVMIGDIMLNGF